MLKPKQYIYSVFIMLKPKQYIQCIYYVKTKTIYIVYYHLRQCLRETHLSSQNKQ